MNLEEIKQILVLMDTHLVTNITINTKDGMNIAIIKDNKAIISTDTKADTTNYSDDDLFYSSNS